MVKSSVKFAYVNANWGGISKREIKNWVIELVRTEVGLPARLQYVFCNDDFLHKMNISFLGHDDFTDIITFDFSEVGIVAKVGEIYISVDRVKANATDYKVPFVQEMCRVIFHGALHLCGYCDKSEVDEKKMRFKENFYLKKFNLC